MTLGRRAEASATPVYISGWASFHPEGELTNHDLASRLDTSEAWISQHIGIETRRVAGEADTACSMGASALGRAIRRAGCVPADIDTVISATSADTIDMPPTAARMANELGINSAFGFDVRAACSGWVVALELARGLLVTGRAERAAVCAAEHITLAIDPDDRESVVFFGDAAAATVVQLERPKQGLELVDVDWSADNSAHDAVVIPRLGYFRMDAKRTRIWVETAIAETAEAMFKRHDIAAPDLRALVCHQANLRLLEWVSDRLGVPAERHWHNVEWAGNTSAAGAPSTLAEGLDEAEGQLEPGDLFLLITVGSGLNVAAALLRWVGR